MPMGSTGLACTAHSAQFSIFCGSCKVVTLDSTQWDDGELGIGEVGAGAKSEHSIDTTSLSRLDSVYSMLSGSLREQCSIVVKLLSERARQ